MPVSTRNGMRTLHATSQPGKFPDDMSYHKKDVTHGEVAVQPPITEHADSSDGTPISSNKKRIRTTQGNPTHKVSLISPSPVKQMRKEADSPPTKRMTPRNLDAATPDTEMSDNQPILSSVEITPVSLKKRSKKTTATAAIVRTAPENWQEIYTLVEELRSDRTAPCDHSGCEALAAESLVLHPKNDNKNVNLDIGGEEKEPATFRFQVLISLMLSSQTKDAVVGAAIRAMQADGVLTISAIAKMDDEVLKRYIAKVGFFNNKTKYIKETVTILVSDFDSDIPRTAAEMIQSLPGVGPKMAYICEGAAWNTYTGIGVDTHMHRLFNQLKWVDAKTPEHTRVQLESWLPRSHWADVNLLWVGFGQELQQEKIKILHKALDCSRPREALQLLKRCNLDYRKVAKEIEISEEVLKKALST